MRQFKSHVLFIALFTMLSADSALCSIVVHPQHPRLFFSARVNGTRALGTTLKQVAGALCPRGRRGGTRTVMGPAMPVNALSAAARTSQRVRVSCRIRARRASLGTRTVQLFAYHRGVLAGIALRTCFRVVPGPGSIHPCGKQARVLRVATYEHRALVRGKHGKQGNNKTGI